MTNILYMAVSKDRFIAGENDDVSWVSDESWQSYQGFVAACDVVIVGKSTFELMETDEFAKGPRYIVATHRSDCDAGKYEVRNIKTLDDMPRAARVGIIGGGELNGSLAALGVIDEVILDEEDITLGTGKKLFGSHTPPQLKLTSENRIGPKTVQKHYRVTSGNS